MNTEEQINDLIAISGRLMKLMKKENEVLLNGKPSDLTVLTHEKNILTRAYEVRAYELKNSSAQLDEVDDSLRRQLEDIGRELNDLVEKNASFLRAGMEASRCVVEAVAEAVQVHQPGPGTYNATGEVGQSSTRTGNRSSSLTLNQSL